jgi:hypothetical protein
MVRPPSAFLAAILILAAANVQATVIDLFDAAPQYCSVSAGGTSSSDHGNPGASAIGGYRDIAMTWVNGKRSSAEVFTGADGTGLSFTQGTSQAKTTVIWDGANTPNVISYLLGKDLTIGGDNEFLLDIGEVTATGLNLKMTVYSADADHASVYSTFVPSGSGSVLSVLYGAFAQAAGAGHAADFGSVGAISLELNGTGNSGSDITLNSIKTGFSPTVPEPSTLALAAIGFLAFFGVGRRWKKA